MTGATNGSTSRRDALKLGAMGLSLGAIAAACGDHRGGDDDPGRVGSAPAVTSPPELEVDDSVLLRTASSLELSGADLLEGLLADGLFGSSMATVVDAVIADHRATAAEMADLTSGAGGTPWNCPNDWVLTRELGPPLAALGDSDQPEVDAATLAIAFENMAASAHQELAAVLGAPELRVAATRAAALNARHGAMLAIAEGGESSYFSPELIGEEIDTDLGIVPQYAIVSRYGALSGVEVVVGAPDENGVRARYTLQTPAANAFVYNELNPSC